MRVIPPLAMTDVRLVSHSVPETDAAVWASGTTYALGNQVMRVAGVHAVFECVAAHTATPAPLPENDAARWLRVGATNRWRGFTLTRNEATAGASPLSFKVSPGQRMDAVALYGVQADSVRVVVRDAAAGLAVLYDQTQSMSTRVVRDMYEHMYAPFTSRMSTVFLQLPPITSAEVEVVLTRGSGDASYQAFVCGMAFYLGDAQFGAASDVLIFSKVERDAFGGATLVRRKSVPTMNLSLQMTKQSFALSLALREQLDAVPAAWMAVDKADDGYFEGLSLLGVYKRWPLSAAYVADASAQLEIEGI